MTKDMKLINCNQKGIIFNFISLYGDGFHTILKMSVNPKHTSSNVVLGKQK